MSPALERIGQLRLIPVIALEDADAAEPVAEALLAGGLPCAEVTFRTAAAAAALQRIARYDEICLGAGTVLTVEQVKSAVDCGATFIVSPGFNPRVVGYCVDHDIPVTPGICTPTQIEMGLDCGLDVLKFFPAEAFGGVRTLKAIGAPYASVRFIPTGGISAGNLCEYLSCRNVLACGGSWMVKQDLIAEGRFDRITELTREAVQLIASL